MIHTCLRKVEYSLVRKLKSDNESEATIFGSAIHKALEHWYSLKETERTLSAKESAQADILLHNANEPHTGALESIRQYVLRGSALHGVADDDKRSLSNGIKILKAYFKLYQNDGLEIVCDSAGPIVERNVEFKLYEDSEVEIHFFGTIDAILRNKASGHIMVTDHKTTSALGKEFYNRIKPNHQYTGYVLGARLCLGIDTNLFLVNGIQVAKTKTEFARQVTERTEDDFNELRAAVIHAVRTFLAAREVGFFPQHAPQPCTQYGGCQYLDICSSPTQLRETIINARYNKN